LIRNLFRRLRKNDRGAALVEFAIVALLLITLLLGIIEFGWLLTGWVVVTGAAREGARAAVVWDIDEIEDRVNNHTDLLPFESVTLSPAPEIGNPGEETTIYVTGELPLLVGFFPIQNPFPIPAKATMRQEFERQY
jgi:Flp pilus assembly pilin Flp